MMDLTLNLQSEIGLAQLQKEEREKGPFLVTSMDGSYSMEANQEDLERNNITVADWHGGYSLDINESKNLLKTLGVLESARNELEGIVGVRRSMKKACKTSKT